MICAIIINRERAKAGQSLISKKKGRVHQATNYVEPGPARRHKPINLFPEEDCGDASEREQTEVSEHMIQIHSENVIGRNMQIVVWPSDCPLTNPFFSCGVIR